MITEKERLTKLEERVCGLYALLHPDLECPRVPVEHVLAQMEALLRSGNWEHDSTYPRCIQAFVRWSPDAVISLRDCLRAAFPLTHIEVDRDLRGEEADLIDGLPADYSRFYKDLQSVRKQALEFHPDT